MIDERETKNPCFLGFFDCGSIFWVLDIGETSHRMSIFFLHGIVEADLEHLLTGAKYAPNPRAQTAIPYQLYLSIYLFINCGSI